MTQANPYAPSPDDPDIQVGGFYGVPIVKINRMPQNLPSGEELSNRIVNAMRVYTPEYVHEEYGAQD